MHRGMLFIRGTQTASTDTWHNIGEPPHRDRTQLYIYILRKKVTPLRSRGHLCPLGKTFSKRRWWTKHYFYATYNVVLGALPRQFNPHTHLRPCDPKVSHETRVEGQTLLSDLHLGSCDLNDSHDV